MTQLFLHWLNSNVKAPDCPAPVRIRFCPRGYTSPISSGLPRWPGGQHFLPLSWNVCTWEGPSSLTHTSSRRPLVSMQRNQFFEEKKISPDLSCLPLSGVNYSHHRWLRATHGPTATYLQEASPYIWQPRRPRLPGACTDLTGCWAGWSRRVGREQLLRSQQALLPWAFGDHSGVTWMPAGCGWSPSPLLLPPTSPRPLPRPLLRHFFSSHPHVILRASSTTPPPTERDRVPSWT